MKINFFSLTAICLTILVVAPTNSPAQVRKQGSGYLFRLSFKKGQVIKYNIVAEAVGNTGKDQGFKMNLPATMTVKDLAKGIATIESSVSPPQANSKPDVKVFKVNDRGDLVSGNVPVQGQGMFISYPKVAISPGYTWKAKTTQSGISADVKYTFVSIKTVEGQQMAVVTVNMKGSGAQSFTGGGQMLIQMSDGILYKMNTDMTLATGGKPMKMRMTMMKTR